MLPTFLVIGSYKAATTSLYSYLAAHPQVFMSEEKETFFFTDEHFDRGLEWYERTHFAGAEGALAAGEASTAYSAWPLFDHVPERVAASLPGVKLVYLLRHPVERMLSQYRFESRVFAQWQTIEQAMVDEQAYLSRSRYALQIDRWLEHVDRGQLLALTSEDLRDHRAETVRRAFAFLGVDPDVPLSGLTTEHNRREDIRQDRGAVSRLRASRVNAWGRRVVPAGLRHSIWHRLGSEPVRPDIAAADISDALRPDLERLPAHVEPDLGPGFDCWGLLRDPLATSRA